MSILRGKTVVHALTGGISCYKGAEVTRALVREGARVLVVLTPGAERFITRLTLQTLSGNAVATDLFDLAQEAEIGHIRLADDADVLLVAPATASSIAKLAVGLADDLLGAVALATVAPVVIAPAMNVNMWENPKTVRNVASLVEDGATVVPPGEGFLACGWEGAGRLAETAEIVEAVRRALTPKRLHGERVLVSAGPTREAIDPVRYLSNRSSGKMGVAIAAAARRAGAEVKLVAGPGSVASPAGVERIDVETAHEMRAAIVERDPWASVVVMAAAVADFTIATPASTKVKKAKGRRANALELEPTVDILAELGGRTSNGRLLVGFAAETGDGSDEARRKLREKSLDLIVLNDVTAPGAGFDVDTNQVAFFDADGGEERTPIESKEEIADRIVARIAALRSG